jgi:hypothetical protein
MAEDAESSEGQSEDNTTGRHQPVCSMQTCKQAPRVHSHVPAAAQTGMWAMCCRLHITVINVLLAQYITCAPAGTGHLLTTAAGTPNPPRAPPAGGPACHQLLCGTGPRSVRRVCMQHFCISALHHQAYEHQQLPSLTGCAGRLWTCAGVAAAGWAIVYEPVH